MHLDAECGYGRRVGRILENPGALEHPRTWRAEIFSFNPPGVGVLVKVSVTCLTGDSAMRSRGEDIRGRVEAPLRDGEMRKMRNLLRGMVFGASVHNYTVRCFVDHFGILITY